MSSAASEAAAVEFDRAEPAAGLIAQVERCMAADGPLTGVIPGFTRRAAQAELAAAVCEAIASFGTLVAEAGTGVGKSLAYLIPALASGRKVLVSTGTKTLQDQLFDKDLALARRATGSDARIALLKGRSNYVCWHHLERSLGDGRFASPEVPVRLRQIERFARLDEHGDRSDCSQVPEDHEAWAYATSTRENCLGQDCPRLGDCFVMRARRRAQDADLVVVNHHLFFADLALREEGVAELLPTTHVVVFDEAHQLPDVGTVFLSRSVSTRQLIDLARDGLAAGLAEAPDGADWARLAGKLDRAARELRLQWPGGAPRRPAHELIGAGTVREALDATRAAAATLAGELEAQHERGPLLARCAQRAGDLLEALRGWCGEPLERGEQGGDASVSGGAAATVAEGDALVRWAEAHAHSLSLYCTPLSIADAFSRHRDGPPRAWIFVSATLSLDRDFSHFTAALGLQQARCLRWDSPFDFERNALLYVPTDLGDAGSDGFSQRLAERAWSLIVANRGRAFVLCTSLRAVRQVAQRLRELGDRPDATASDARAAITVLEQGQQPRTTLLERFRSAEAPVLVGSASFWEGVDIVGERLSLVIIDKLPFAAPNDPVLSARIDAMARRGVSAFEALQLPLAAISLKQGSGRLIRSETDRGLLVIGDDRLLRKGYGRRLVRSLPPFRVTRDVQSALRFVATP